MTTEELAGDWGRMRGIVPKIYMCRRATSVVTIDGKLDDPAWQAAPWTDDFVDIEGPHRPDPPRLRTRAKMVWDDEFLYIAAELSEPHLCGVLKEKNSRIFTEDNDFEIFIDPDGDHHNYYEFEMNALNTIWELTLPKPYRDQGDPKLGTNITGLRSAVWVDGTINDPRDIDRGWTLEVAIPWRGLASYNSSRPTPPRNGDTWRINFSRVQWTWDIIAGQYERRGREINPEDNWVWSPQGVIDMHRPERWGVIVFSQAETSLAPAAIESIRSELAARDVLMEVYYRQRSFYNSRGRWAKSLSELRINDSLIDLKSDEAGWTASMPISRPSRQRVLHVRQDSRLGVD